MKGTIGRCVKRATAGRPVVGVTMKYRFPRCNRSTDRVDSVGGAE